MSYSVPSVVNSAKVRLRPAYRWLRKKVPVSLRRRIAHAVKQRQLLSLKNPRTFNEKLSWRMVFDRRDLLKPTCDKLAMKELARTRAGDLVRIPEVFWTGTDLSEVENLDLPEHWVLKPNHRSALVYFGRGKADAAQLRSITTGWLDEINWQRYGEWAYSHARRVLLIEERIGNPNEVQVDYKFQVFDGRVRVAVVYLGRFHDLRGYLMDRDFQLIPAYDTSEVQRPGDVVEKPDNFDLMVEIAERIAAGFDYLRVDLYDTGGEVWFGETTPYEANGRTRFQPSSFDLELGSYWKLPQL